MSNEAEEFEFRLRMEREAAAPAQGTAVMDAGSAVASPPPVKAQSKYSPFQNYVGSAIEPNLALLTGSVAAPIAGLRGLATGAGNILGMTKADPAEAIRSTQEALTYAPRTEGGKTAMEAISYPFKKLSEGAEYLGDKAMDVTGSPTVGAITKTAIESAPMIAGMRLGGTDAAIGSAQRGVNAVKSLGHVADVLKPTGPANILKRGQQKLLGNDPAVEARVIAATENAPEIVRGSKPTVMEAVSEIPEATGLAKHQQQIARKEGLSPAFSARAAEQQAAREAAISDVAQTPNLLAQAVARRKAKADPLYQQARAGGDVVNAGPLVDKISDVLKRNPGNRELVTELTNVKKGLIDSEGFIRTNAEEVASVMDGLKKAIADENNKFIRGNLTEIKNDLADAIPNYQKAQKTFANESKPINEMQVGQELERALKSPSGELERAATFQQAIRNAPQTIKKATGQPRFTELSEVLPPSKLSKVEAVAKELARKEASERLAGHTGSAGIEALDLTRGMVPPMLARIPMIGRWLADTAAEHVQPKIEALASELYRNPKMQAEFLRTVPPSRQAMIIEALTKRAAPYAVTGAITNAARHN